MKWQKQIQLYLSLGVLCAVLLTFFKAIAAQSTGSSTIFLPLLYAPPPPPVLKVNAPFFSGPIQPNEAAIFWFGRVYETDNYADVRIGSTSTELYIRLAVFDRQLWYDTSPSVQDLTDWDSAGVFLNLNGNQGDVITSNTYAFYGQLAWSEPNMEAAYQGSAVGWQQISAPFTSIAGWQSDNSGINDDNKPDRGWTLSYLIPFSSLGLTGAPPPGTVWGLGIVIYDRDDAAGAIEISNKTWQPTLATINTATWGQLSFGLPQTTAAPVQTDGTTLIRHGLNGAVVKDGMVGGAFNCGAGLYSFGQWGEANYAGAHQINIQNQYNLADWPCFSKFYITFPLNVLPPGAQITSATLTMMHFSNSGGSNNPVNSLLQVLTVADNWDETTLTWNNAPLAVENISQIWVESIYNSAPVPRIWDVSAAVIDAQSRGEPLRLVVYSADADQHSGKYFISSDAGAASAANRPTLTVNWANP